MVEEQMTWSAPWSRRSRGIGANVSEYGMEHRPPADGAPLHDLLEGGQAPRDIYSTPFDWYTGFPEYLGETAEKIRRVRGQPDAPVSVYRAGPTHEFNPGDWVTLSPGYANEHRDSIDPTSYKTCKLARVPAKYVRWAGDDLMEWGYWGPKRTSLRWESCERNRALYRKKR
jgi:hypothetical protein